MMRKFNEVDIENYLKYTNKNVIELEEVLGHCFICGELLNQVALPQGLEKQVVCLKDRKYFAETFEELVEIGEIK